MDFINFFRNKGNKSGMFFFLPKVNGFHQFLPEIDEDKKYPDIPVNPVNPVRFNIIGVWGQIFDFDKWGQGLICD
jgi:hypothetical protein